MFGRWTPMGMGARSVASSQVQSASFTVRLPVVVDEPHQPLDGLTAREAAGVS